MTERWRLHPSLRGRSSPLGSGDPPTCDFERAEDGHPAGGTRYVCPACERPWFVYGPGDPPDDRPCPQMKVSGGPSPVSDRREERRRRRGIRGPLCRFVYGVPCQVATCAGPSDPAHYRSVGSGRADWINVGGSRAEGGGARWVGNVVNLCRPHHRRFDGEVGGGSGNAFEERHDVDLEARAEEIGEAFAERYDVDLGSDEHPYQQIGWSP